VYQRSDASSTQLEELYAYGQPEKAPMSFRTADSNRDAGAEPPPNRGGMSPQKIRNLPVMFAFGL
jgi:hypothetical protein